ncbi:MAG: AraC family transcriptional regulator [Prevotella sp.]|nr:AraC family transcriptional regulator [Prevotella sp.]MBR1464621.1 AraC family transcriptional regulator [Prevotella sp.]
MQQQLYNLAEFSKLKHIPATYGSSVACVITDRNVMNDVWKQPFMLSFFSVILVIDGKQEYTVSGNRVALDMHDLLVTLPHQTLLFEECSQEVTSLHLLIDSNYFNTTLSLDERLRSSLPFDMFSSLPVFHLGETKAAEFLDLFRQIHKAIMQPHVYKDEMIRHLIHICQLFIAEQVYGDSVATHDLKHKENIFKIFIHLAARNFRKERQVKFYADQLNISPTYLSRVVRELSGNTVYGYISNFLYNEICMLLKTTDMTMAEISDRLNFSDQSALTNFFKQKSGASPLAYRKGNTQG